MSQTPRPDLRQPAEAVLKFLSSIATEAEAEFYLRLFRSRSADSFATLAVSATSLAHGLDGVVMDLSFLQALQLVPIVVLGLDAPADATAHAELLASHLRIGGLTATPQSIDASAAEIAGALHSGAVPLLVANDPDASRREHALARILRDLATPKLIHLRPEGGFIQGGKRVSVVNLTTQYSELLASGALTPSDTELMRASRTLLFDLVPHRLLVSVTSPINLLRELFTVKGAGTLLRKGIRIERFASYEGVDAERLMALLASSFGKPAAPTLLDRKLQALYLDEGYRGAAIVMDSPHGPYLSKFAVTREAQGEGIGQDLWDAFVPDCETLFWRARRDNPIRAWYERQCQGRFDSGDWTVYFRGLTPAQIAPAIAYALAQPRDF